MFKKNKIVNEKLTEKSSADSIPFKDINKASIVVESKSNVLVQKKKKKRNLYAGLNPLVFKNRDFCKNKSKKPSTS